MNRRSFLKLGGITAAAAGLSACAPVGAEVARQDVPEALSTPLAPDTYEVDTVVRFLHRAGYGPRPGDVDRARALGLAALLEEQLDPASIEDAAAELIVAGLSTYHMDPTQVIEYEPQDVIPELYLATVSRALYSKRQLYEAMVEFWSDHFHIYLRKNRFTSLLKPYDDRTVIREHALGNFRDLLGASAASPCMLIYLDNNQNTAEAPNENYARELMELHTVGVDGGYTEEDVRELSRVLTGWGVRRANRIGRGTARFNPDAHDDGEKVVMGQVFPAGQGEADITQVLDFLAAHPATAQFIATKLVRRFVADDPPASLVAAVAETFTQTGGDIKSMLRTLFLSDEFATAPPKLKRPYTFVVASMRALNAQIRMRGIRPLGDTLRLMGQVPFMWPTPDGYPDTAGPWSNNVLPRWNFALRLANNNLPGLAANLEDLAALGQVSSVDEVLTTFSGLVLGRDLTADERATLKFYTGDGAPDNAATRLKLIDAVGLMLASPAFQWM